MLRRCTLDLCDLADKPAAAHRRPRTLDSYHSCQTSLRGKPVPSRRSRYVRGLVLCAAFTDHKNNNGTKEKGGCNDG